MARTSTRTRTVVLGRPGAHARVLARRGLLRALLFGLAAAAVVWLVLPAVAPQRFLVLPWAHESAAAAAGLVLARTRLGPFHRARVGARSEVRVARALKRLRPAAVVHGALIDGRGGDADHLVLGVIAALVETKTGRGRVRVATDGTVHAGRRRIPKQPLAQAARQAAKATRAAGVRFTPVLCITDMVGGPFEAHGVTVCSIRDLAGVLEGLPRVLGPEDAVRIARHLHGLGD